MSRERLLQLIMRDQKFGGQCIGITLFLTIAAKRFCRDVGLCPQDQVGELVREGESLPSVGGTRVDANASSGSSNTPPLNPVERRKFDFDAKSLMQCLGPPGTDAAVIAIASSREIKS